MKTEDFLENSQQCGEKVLEANKYSMSVVAKTTVKIHPKCNPEEPEELSPFSEFGFRQQNREARPHCYVQHE